MPDHIFLNGDPRPLWQRLEFEKNLYGTTGQDAASGFSPVQDVPPDSQNSGNSMPPSGLPGHGQ